MSSSINSSCFSVESILVDGHMVKNQTIIIKEGLIESIYAHNDPSLTILSGTLVPGLIDIQVNGGGGCLFNHEPSIASIQTIAKAHQQYGTTGWLPTLITDSLAKMKLAADAVAISRKQKSLGVLGIHFEGPHLSVAKKGVHLEKYIRKLTDAEGEIYLRKDLGKVIVTLAPEMVSAEIIRELVDSGVIVCLGHSNASFEQTQQALEAGATGFTHLFNAMSQFDSRQPGMVGAALLNQNVYYGLILDGIHVHYDAVKLALKMNPNMMLVTDAMPVVASDENSFDYFGECIKLKNNSLTDSEGRLAGSNLNMALAVKNCVEKLDINLIQAVKYAAYNPAKFLGLENILGSISLGNKANMVLLDHNLELSSVWIEGCPVDK